MNIKPLFDRVIACTIKNENTTKSGISLTTTQDTSVKKAKVVSVGTGCYENGIFVDMQVKVNDIIFYEEHTTAKIYIENKEYILINQTDILAIENNNIGED